MLQVYCIEEDKHILDFPEVAEAIEKASALFKGTMFEDVCCIEVIKHKKLICGNIDGNFKSWFKYRNRINAFASLYAPIVDNATFRIVI